MNQYDYTWRVIDDRSTYSSISHGTLRLVDPAGYTIGSCHSPSCSCNDVLDTDRFLAKELEDLAFVAQENGLGLKLAKHQAEQQQLRHSNAT